MITVVAKNMLAAPRAFGDNAKIIGKGKLSALGKVDVQSSAGSGLSKFFTFEKRIGNPRPIPVIINPPIIGTNQ